MASIDRDLKKIEILQKFYVEKVPKVEIARVLECSPTTVKKHIKDNPEDSALVQSLINDNLTPTQQIVKNPHPFKFLQISHSQAIQSSEPLLKHIDFLKLANDIVIELGIVNELDKLKVETALEEYIAYRCCRRREIFINGELFDKDVLKNAEKLASMALKFADASNRHLNTFNSIIRELEIKYRKRFPDIGRIQNLNIQKNEFTLNHASS